MRPMLAKLVADIPPGLSTSPSGTGSARSSSATATRSRSTAATASRWRAISPTWSRRSGESLPTRCVVDGEIVVISPATRRLDFFALQQRVHPAASRVDRLAARRRPASSPSTSCARRRGPHCRHRSASAARRWSGRSRVRAPPLHLTPITRDATLAREWFERFEGAGLDGVIAKDGEHSLPPDMRAMFKIKHQRTVDCVVCRLPPAQGRAGGDRVAPARALRRRRRRAALGEVLRRPAADRRDRLVPDGPPPRAARRAAPARDRPGRPSVARHRRATSATATAGTQPGAAVRRARAGAGDRGPLRPHGRRRSSATPPRSCAGARTATRPRAASRSSSARRSSTLERSSRSLLMNGRSDRCGAAASASGRPRSRCVALPREQRGWREAPRMCRSGRTGIRQQAPSYLPRINRPGLRTSVEFREYHARNSTLASVGEPRAV